MSQSLFAAPDGYVVDFENPQRTGQAANFYAGCIGMVLATSFLGIRIYSKVFLAKQLCTDDVQLSRGTLGVHIWEIPSYKINSTFNLLKICAILYCPFLAAAKFSLLFLYLRLSRLRWFRMSVFASMFLVVGSNIALTIPLIFTCTPISQIDGSCLDPAPIHIASSALDVATNTILLTLPIPIMVKWKASGLERAGLAFIFSAGTATCTISIIRLALTPAMVKSTDLPWAIATPTLWTLIETTLILTTSTLPTLRVLLLHHMATALIPSPRLAPPSGPGPRIHAPGPSHQPAMELTPTHSTFKDRKRYSRMTADSDGASISSAELASWGSDAGGRKSGVAVPSPVLDRSPSKKSVGTIVKTRTTTVTSELVPGFGLGLGEEKRASWASWTPPY
ncbi:integral membrane protein [Stagonosporopsis vannaccii]|nr:integral membrane protein [Stagonosporopsis vannaccii]